MLFKKVNFPLLLWSTFFGVCVICLTPSIIKTISAANHILTLIKTRESLSCSVVDQIDFSKFTFGQRYAIGGILLDKKCLQNALAVLPAIDESPFRGDLITYHRGRIAWSLGKQKDAILIWRQGKNIDKLMLERAGMFNNEGNYSEALKYYEITIKISGSQLELAENLTFFIEALRGKIEPTIFASILDDLAEFMGEDTPAGNRIKAQALQLRNNYQDSYLLFIKAQEAGFDDSETWFYIGESLWQMGDLNQAEYAFNEMVFGDNQFSWRKGWYYYRLGYFLLQNDRFMEALPYLEHAVALSKYYEYFDILSILYSRLGNAPKASQLCFEARKLANQNQNLKCKND